MKKLIKDRLVDLLLTILVATFSFYLFSPYVFDDYGSFMENLAMGQYSNYPMIDWYFLGYTGVNVVLKFLYAQFPDYNWIVLIDYFPIYIALYLLLRIYRKVIYPKVSIYFYLFLLIITFYSFIDSIFNISFTRSAMLMCGMSLIYLLFLPASRWKKFILYLLVIISILSRSEAGMAAIFVVSAVYFFYSESIIETVKKLWIPYTVLAIFLLVVSSLIKYSDDFLFQVEPNLEYEMMMKKNIVDISAMKSSTDSLRYEMATNGMWIDNDIVSVEFMNSLIYKSTLFTKEGFKNASNKLYKMLGSYSSFIGILFFLCFFNYYLLPQKSQKKYLLILLIILSLPIYYLAYRNLLGYRHFHPYVLLSCFAVTLYLFKDIEYFRYDSLLKACLGSVMLLIVFVFIKNQHFKDNIFYKHEVKNYQCNHQFRKLLLEGKKDETIVLTLSALRFHDNFLTLRKDIDTSNQFLMYDLFNYSKIESYIKYLSKTCNCNAEKPAEFFKWLAQTNSFIIMDERRNQLLTRYFKEIAQENIYFELDNDLSDKEDFEDCKTIELSGNHLYKVRMQ